VLTHATNRLPLFPLLLVASAALHGSAFILLGAVATTPPELLPSHPGFVSVRLIPSLASETKEVPEKPVDLVADLPRMDEPIKAPDAPDSSVPPPPRRAPLDRPRSDADPEPKLAPVTKIITPVETPELVLDVLPVLETFNETAKRTIPKIQPLERPRTEIDPAPKLAPVMKIITPAEVPKLVLDLAPIVDAVNDAPKQTTPNIQALQRPRNPIDPAPKFPVDTKIVTPAEVPDLNADLIPTMVVPKEVAKKTTSNPSPIARPTPKITELPRLEAVTKIAKIASVSSPASQEVQGTVDELPTKLPFNLPPPYPKAALDAGQEGNVTLRVSINAEGRVTAISVYSPSGVAALDDSALTTVRRWQFAPARRGGTAVPYEVLVPVEFSIRRR